MRFKKYQLTGVLVAQVCGTVYSCSHTKAPAAHVASRLQQRLHLKITRCSFSVCIFTVTGSNLPDPTLTPLSSVRARARSHGTGAEVLGYKKTTPSLGQPRRRLELPPQAEGPYPSPPRGAEDEGTILGLSALSRHRWKKSGTPA